MGWRGVNLSDGLRAPRVGWLRSKASPSWLVAALGAGLVLASPSAEAQGNESYSRLYVLQTNCSVRGMPQRCQVEAFDGKSATVYRTTIDGLRTSYRLVDTPGQRGAQLWSNDSRSWVALGKLSLDFDTRTLCLNGDQLCVENPNYFASLRQQYPDLRSDLIVARFDAKTAQLSAICYSREACNAGF